jgi:hypothetical protein
MFGDLHARGIHLGEERIQVAAAALQAGLELSP